MPSPPDEFLCPITLTLMRDPVIGPDGHSYERTAITQWLQTNPHSPLTRQPMTVKMLQSNISLKKVIENYKLGKENRTPRNQITTHPESFPVPPPALSVRPITHVVPRPSAPPAELFEIQVYPQTLVQPLLVPTTYSTPSLPGPPTNERLRRQKILGACLCFTFTVILVIIIIRFYEGLSD